MRTAWLLVLCACSHDEAKAPPAPPPPPVVVVAKPPAPAKPAQLTHVTIKALGMYCEESCPMRVRYALADIKQIYELGFDPWLAKTSWPDDAKVQVVPR